MGIPRQTTVEGGVVMSDIESTIRTAYSSVTMPAGLKEKTLLFIAEQHEKEQQLAVQEKASETTTFDQGNVTTDTMTPAHSAATDSMTPAPGAATGTRAPAPNAATDTVQPAGAEPAAPFIPPKPEKTSPTEAPTEQQAPTGGVAVLRRRRASRTLGLALAACVALFLVAFGGFRMIYLTETAYVSIDINPSLELGINRFDVVVSAQAFNDDAQAILDELDLVSLPYEEAMDALAANALYQSYITSDSFVEISVVCDNQDQSQGLQQRSQGYLDTLPCEGTCTRATTELRTEAHDAHMGVGRYQAALILLELDNTLTLADCEMMTMRELRERIIALGGEAPETYHNGHGHGRGAGAGSGVGAGSGTGAGNGSGAGAGSGSGTGAGAGTGSGAGSGTGTGSGSGAGASSGSGTGQGQNMSQTHYQDTSQCTIQHSSLQQGHSQSEGAPSGSGYTGYSTGHNTSPQQTHNQSHNQNHSGGHS